MVNLSVLEMTSKAMKWLLLMFYRWFLYTSIYLYIKYQANHGYTVRPYLKKTKTNKNKNQIVENPGNWMQ